MEFWDYGKCVLDGWHQSADIHGKFFGSWSKQLEDGMTLNISLGEKSKRYWLRIGNCYHGNHASPEKAASAAAKILNANA